LLQTRFDQVAEVFLQTGVEGTDDRVQVLLHHVRVDFGGLDVGVAHELLDHTDVDAVFQKMGGKRVPQGMAVACLVMPARSTAVFTAFCREFSPSKDGRPGDYWGHSIGL